jgi:hypothetical protein
MTKNFVEHERSDDLLEFGTKMERRGSGLVDAYLLEDLLLSLMAGGLEGVV